MNVVFYVKLIFIVLVLTGLCVNIKEGLCSKLSEVWAIDLYLSASQRNVGSMAYAF